MMKSILLAPTILAVAVAGRLGAQVPVTPASAPASANPVRLDAIVGVAGDQAITRYDLQEAVLSKLQRKEVPEPTDSASARALELEVLNDLIDDELLIQKANDLKVTVEDAEISPQVDQQVRQVRANFRSEGEFRSELQHAGLGTPDDYRRYLMDQFRRQILRDRVIQKLTADGKIVPVSVSDAEIAAEFDRAKSYLPKKPATVTFKQIVIAPQPTAAAKEVARVRAESLLAQVKSGTDFEKLAKRESMDPLTKEIGGDLGWMRRGVRPYLDRWLFGNSYLPPVPPGQLSPVFETTYGFHILRVDRAQPGEVRAHQILVTARIDSADIARTAKLADSVAALLRSGAPFDTLARKYNDYGAGEETSILTPFTRDSLPASYQQAFASRKVGDVVAFQIAGSSQRPDVPKYVVAQLLTAEEAGERTLDEMREAVRSELAQRGGVRRYLDRLRTQAFVAVYLDGGTTASAGKARKP